MTMLEEYKGIDFEPTLNPYQRVTDNINRMFGGELPDNTPLSWITNYFRQDKTLDPLIARKFNRTWAIILSRSNSREKSMITRTFHALANTSLETVGDLRNVSETRQAFYYRLGYGTLAFSKACLAPKPQERVS
ncbi:MAG: hypothetical protein M1405_02140 [Patescibacteria group bacterium]|nr:hypothetical protein [Patescibacteria group bacterium]